MITGSFRVIVRITAPPTPRTAVLGDITIDAIDAALGPTVSRMTMSGLDGAEELPAASVSRAVRLFAPGVRAVVAVIDQAPVMASAAPVPISVVPL
jgi:hypothetical protein